MQPALELPQDSPTRLQGKQPLPPGVALGPDREDPTAMAREHESPVHTGGWGRTTPGGEPRALCRVREEKASQSPSCKTRFFHACMRLR